MKSDQTATPSTDNIFADIGLPNPEDHLAKAQIVVAIDDHIKSSGLTQTAAARKMGIAQPDLSKLLRGRFSGFSLERLIGFLLALGHNVDLQIHPANENDEVGHLRLVGV
jgi:predicted XRE-type DNA-binding protein